MAVQFRLPDISGSDKEQLAKIRSYLYQIIPELEFAMNTMNTSISQVSTPTPKSQIPTNTMSEANAQVTFNAIKSLIIKSADIVNAYYDQINTRLEGVYVAESDFGTFAEKTTQQIEETSTSTTQGFENVQAIMTENGSRIADIDEDLQDSKAVITESIQGVQDKVTGVNLLLEDAKAQLRGSIEDLEVYVTGLENVIIGVSAYLKSGLLDYTDAGIPIYGLEIGQSVMDEESGTEVFSKYARFTSEKLSFYDSNGIEVAYISDKKLYIKMAHITISLQLGGIIQLVMSNGDVVEKWVGIGG